MVDSALLAAKIAAVRDATARVRAVLPTSVEAFVADRTTREVVTLNIFVAIQDCLDLAAHWLADAGWEMPGAYADVFTALARHAVIPHELATRLAAAAAFRNLVAHQYGVLDWRRVYALASSDLGDSTASARRSPRSVTRPDHARRGLAGQAPSSPLSAPDRGAQLAS